MNVIAKLFGLKTVAEFATVLPELQQDLITARERLARLKAQMRDAPFEAGEEEVKRLRAEIRETEDEIETLTGLVDETGKRQRAAVEKEEDRQVLLELSQARSSTMALRDDFKQLDQHVVALRDIVGRVGPVIDQVRKANARAGVVDGFYSTPQPPSLFDERVRLPNIPLAEIGEAVDRLSRHGVSTWFTNMEAAGKLK